MKPSAGKAWADEPWRAEEGAFFIKGEEGWGSILSAQDWFIAKLEDSLDPLANSQRITSAVNAVAGLVPEKIPEAVEALRACHGLLGELARAEVPASVRTRVMELEKRAASVLAGLFCS